MAPRVPANGEGLLADLDLKLSRAHDTPAAARTAALAARALRRGLSEIPDDIEQNLGWTIVGFIVGVSLGYLLLGLIYGLAKGRSGVELIPNHEIWGDLAQLVYDGCLYFHSLLCGGGSSRRKYDKIVDERESHRGEEDKKRKKEKKEKREKKKKKSEYDDESEAQSLVMQEQDDAMESAASSSSSGKNKSKPSKTRPADGMSYSDMYSMVARPAIGNYKASR